MAEFYICLEEIFTSLPGHCFRILPVAIVGQILCFFARYFQLVLHCVPSVKRHFENKLLQLSQPNDDKSISKHLGVLRHLDHVTKDYQVKFFDRCALVFVQIY